MIKLYMITEGNPETNLYVCSSETEDQRIRYFADINDHGGMSYEDYYRVAKQGKIIQIESLDQVTPADYDTIPFCTDEWIAEFEDYLFVDETIRSFLAKK